jgi:lipopolysaccharide export system permease protein
VFQIAPLSLLVSALLVLGDTAQHNEVTSALAGGISLRRFCRVPILIAGAFALALFVMEEGVGPAAAREAQRVEDMYFRRKLDGIRTSTSWANLSGKWTCHIAKFNHLAHTGEGVFIHAMEEETLTQIEAGRIYWDDENGQWLLEDGRWMVFPARANRILENRRITQVPAPFTETPRELFALTDPPETKSVRRLADDIAAATARGVPTNRLRVDYHAKFSQPAVSFVMVWLAIPFALRLRRGGLAISFGISILVAIAFLTVYSVCMTLGHAGRISPVMAAWFANAVFLAAGIRLFVKTPT